jgi:hypothetical protein
MGQYFRIVNLDKKEFLHPGAFDCGVKLTEFACDSQIMFAISALLSDGNGQGGGDMFFDDGISDEEVDAVVGRWAGDRIVFSGDYAEKGKFTDDPEINVYDATKEFNDISEMVINVLRHESYDGERFGRLADTPSIWRDSYKRFRPDYVGGTQNV